MARDQIIIACSECKRRNYTGTKKKQAGGATKRLELKKYCRWCKKHTLHKEIK